MTDAKFGWTDFYMEFAGKLLAYRENRGPLVEFVRGLCRREGFPYLDNHPNSDGTTGLQDICPFTTMGTFNRGISNANRQKIALELGEFLRVTEPPPNSFEGIPTLNNQTSVVPWGNTGVDTLWQVFADAIQLADSDTDRTRQSFVGLYDQAQSVKGVGVNLTIGLFWIRPYQYPTLDSKSTEYIASSLAVTLPSPIPPPGREYLELADNLKGRFAEADSPVRSFQELSFAAYGEPTTSIPTSSVWLVRAGADGEYEGSALDHGLSMVDWGAPDVTGVVDKDAVWDLIRQKFPDESNNRIGSITSQLASFLLDMREGDIVVLPMKTQSGRVALGRITGPYAYQEVSGDWFHTRQVDWIRTDVPKLDFGEDLQASLNHPRTIFRIQSNGAEQRIAELLSGNGATQPPLEPPEVSLYNLQNIIDEGCFLELSRLETILGRLKVKKNLILQGPPGTGKTWLAKKLAFALIGQKDDSRVRRFQFHPNLSYEDFILGYRPNDESKLTLVKGPFLETVTRARGNQSNDYVIVIEEINRGNPAQIFGEMLTLLEADKRNSNEALTLAYSSSDSDQSVHIPENLYVIGTMNVADRSIALVDLALRRRFAFVDLEPVFGDVWRNWVRDQCGIPRDFLTTIEERMTALNNRIADYPSLGLQFRVGHSYVTPTPGTQIANPTEWFRDVVDTEIGPLLDEYWFDNLTEAKNAKAELLSGL